jgi:hypothetical protein
MDIDPITFRPRASLRMAVSMTVSLLAASALGWVMTPAPIRAMFNAAQIATLLLFIAAMIGMMLALGLAYVRADAEGLVFRNGIRTHVVPWSEVKAFRYRPGDPWAFVLLRSELEQLPLMGIQRTDRDLAEEHVADLRHRLEQAYGVEG